MNATILQFSPDGFITCLWNETLPLKSLGTLHVKRASWVDFNEHTQQWEVRFEPHAETPAFAHPSREACLAWEAETLNRQLQAA